MVSPIISIISPIISLLFLLSFGRGDQELSKTFYRLKIGPLLRKLQAFKDWSFLGGSPVISPVISHHFHCFPVVFLSFLLSFSRGDQELSKTFYGLKIGPLLRKLEAFKHWSFLGGLSLHLNHLIASCMRICYRQFGTLPIGIFLSNLDSRQLDTSLMTSYGHFWHMSTFGNSRAVWVLLPKYGALRKSKFSQWRSDQWSMRLGVLGGQITGLHDGTIFLGVQHT